MDMDVLRLVYEASLLAERRLAETGGGPDDVRAAIWGAIYEIAPGIDSPEGLEGLEETVDVYVHGLAGRLRAMEEA